MFIFRANRFLCWFASSDS